MIFVAKIYIFLPNLKKEMNKKLPKYLLGKYQLLGTVTFSVLFALIFLNLYIPFSDTAWFGLGRSVNFLFTAGFMFLSMLILVVSRVLMYKTQDMFDMTYLQYVLWCLGEVFLICVLYTFVTVDIVKPEAPDYFHILLKALLYGMIALVIPYIISGMFIAIVEKNRTIRLMRYQSRISDQDSVSSPQGGQITFFDNSGALKFSVSSLDLYYIESDDNYINVWYSDKKGDLKMYMLRCSLKAVEDSFKGSTLLRCHRKYIVNLAKAKVLRKEKDGYFIDLDCSTIDPIPVSKTYSDNILGYFSSVRK